MKTLVVLVVSASALGSQGCGGNSCEIPSGTVIAVARANASGDCPPDVVAGIALLNQTFPLMKPAACGVGHFNLTTTFVQQSNGASCQGADAISFDDLQLDGGAGTDVMTITCVGGVSCTETYDVTFTPQ